MSHIYGLKIWLISLTKTLCKISSRRLIKLVFNSFINFEIILGIRIFRLLYSHRQTAWWLFIRKSIACSHIRISHHILIRAWRSLIKGIFPVLCSCWQSLIIWKFDWTFLKFIYILRSLSHLKCFFLHLVNIKILSECFNLIFVCWA